MPRKSLTGSGISPRINFRVDDEVSEILDHVNDKSRFIREAITYYWENNEKITTQGNSPRPDSQELKESVLKSSSKVLIEKTVNKTWSPPWKQ